MKFKISVVGNGLVGMIAVLKLASIYGKIALIGPEKKKIKEDIRTTALMLPSIHLLKDLAIWNDIKPYATPIKDIRIIDDTSRIIRSPYMNYSATEINEKNFGYNIPNIAIFNILAKAISNCPQIFKITESVKKYNYNKEKIEIILSNNSIVETLLVVGADGYNSITRKFMNINIHYLRYPQIGMILNFSHQFEHRNISTEFLKNSGVFTQVPLSKKLSSLVWILKKSDIKKYLNLKKSLMEFQLEKNMHFFLGKVKLETKIQYFPIRGFFLEKFSIHRMVLIGEAAHTFPPIGALGLNLGIRDIIDLFSILENYYFDPGREKNIISYNFLRKKEILLKTFIIHMINKFLLSDFFSIQLLQNIGFNLIKESSCFRKFLIKEGMRTGDGFDYICHLLKKINQ